MIAFVGTSGMMSMDEKKAVAILPSGHPWQENAALQVGVRTGLCGSVTTFSSWVLQAMQTCLDGNQWLTGVGQLVVGFMCAVVSYQFGIQCALMLHHRLYRGVGLEDAMLGFEEERADYVFGRVSADERPMELSPSVERVGVDLPRQEPLGPGELREGDFTGSREVEKDREGGGGGGGGGGSKTRSGLAAWSEARPKALGTRTGRVGFVCLVLVTLGSSLGVVYETQHAWIRRIWLAMLFAPFGCVGRCVFDLD